MEQDHIDGLGAILRGMARAQESGDKAEPIFPTTALPAAPAPTEQAGELPPLPQSLLTLIGNYGMARTDRVDFVPRWLDLIDGIKDYARAALAARQAPTVPKLDYDLLKLTLEQVQERLRQADEAIVERDATALRVDQCAGEFAKDAARQAPTEAPKGGE